MATKSNQLSEILSLLMRRYSERVPDVMLVIRAMIAEGVIGSAAEIENDHIAFRTLGAPNLGVSSLEKIFLYYGYTKRDYLFFPEKKLNAWWYAPPARQFPRIFISELRVNELSYRSRAIIHSYTGGMEHDPVDALAFADTFVVDRYLHSSSWGLPTLEDYNALAAESEYAAWAIYNRYYLNHFTLSVHNLKMGYNTLAEFNAFVERQSILLNDSGGKIKRSADGLLLQSSTVAQMVRAVFAGGKEKMIPGSYVEFAERLLVPGTRERREGFEAANADKIFESTYFEQAARQAQRRK